MLKKRFATFFNSFNKKTLRNVFLFINLYIKNVSQRFLTVSIKNVAKRFLSIKLHVKKRFATFFNYFNKKTLRNVFLFIYLYVKKRFATFFNYFNKKRCETFF